MLQSHSKVLRIDPVAETLTITGNTVYYGYAKAGSLDADSVWAIEKVINVAGVKCLQYPVNISGYTHLNYDLIWNSRTGYTYR